jgi:hypothetical protein
VEWRALLSTGLRPSAMLNIGVYSPPFSSSLSQFSSVLFICSIIFILQLLSLRSEVLQKLEALWQSTSQATEVKSNNPCSLTIWGSHEDIEAYLYREGEWARKVWTKTRSKILSSTGKIKWGLEGKVGNLDSGHKCRLTGRILFFRKPQDVAALASA